MIFLNQKFDNFNVIIASRSMNRLVSFLHVQKYLLLLSHITFVHYPCRRDPHCIVQQVQLPVADDPQRMHSEWAVFQSVQQQIHTHAYVCSCLFIRTLRVGDFGSDPNFVKTLIVLMLPWMLAK